MRLRPRLRPRLRAQVLTLNDAMCDYYDRPQELGGCGNERPARCPAWKPVDGSRGEGGGAEREMDFPVGSCGATSNPATSSDARGKLQLPPIAISKLPRSTALCRHPLQVPRLPRNTFRPARLACQRGSACANRAHP
mgnify:CR=1 FL=1